MPHSDRLFSHNLTIGILVLTIGLLGLHEIDFLVFHTVTEFIVVVISCAIGIFSWHTRHYQKNHYTTVIGIGYLFVGLLELLHTLSYKGVHIMPWPDSADLPTQLWIAARWTEAGTLALGPLLISKPKRTNLLWMGFTLAVGLVLGSIYSWKNFPTCFIEGKGLTPFKIWNEVGICLTLMVSLLLLHRQKHWFDVKVYQALVFSTILSILAEVAFSLYLDVYGLMNFLGHLLLLLSFILMYVSVVYVGLTQPIRSMFNQLQQNADSLENRIQLRTKALAESRKRFEAAFNHMTIGTAIVDLNCRWLEVNDTLCKMLGYSCEEITKLTCNDISHHEDLELFLTMLEETKQRRRNSFQFDKRFLHKNGCTIWTRLQVSLISDEKGAPTHFLYQIENVSEERKTRHQLNEKDLLFHAIFDQSYQFMGLLDINGNILEANQTALNFAGVERNSIIGQPLWESSWWQTSEKEREKLKSAVSRAAHGHFVRYRTENKGINGSHVVVDFSLKPVFDGDGNVIYLIPEGRNITDLIKLKNEQRHQKELLDAILENLAEAVMVCDAHGHLIRFNKAARSWLGTGNLKIPQQQWAEHFGLFDAEGTKLLKHSEIPLVRAYHGYRVRNMYISIASKDQPIRVVTCNGDPIYEDNGTQLGAVVVMHDVTETQTRADRMQQMIFERTEELEKARLAADKANQAKSQFLSRMSHELRTPLNSVLGFAKLLAISNLSDRQIRNANQIIKAGDHLLDLIDEILDLSRIETGSIKLDLHAIPLKPVLNEAVDIISPMLKKKDIRISMPEEENQDIVVYGDHRRLGQIFLNLLSNAIKYNKQSGMIYIVIQHLNDQRLRVGIKDTGIGISKKYQGKIFQPFERLNAPQKQIDGTGLGLCLSRNLMESMSGSITFESVINQGTTFWVEINKTKKAESNLVLKDEIGKRDNTPKQANTENYCVLYIDDNSDNLDLVQQLFIDEKNYRLLTCKDGLQGFEMAVENEPNVILLDLHLPTLSGEEVLRKLRSDPRTINTFVVIISADAITYTRDDLISMGANEFLTKPLDVLELKKILRNHRQFGYERQDHQSTIPVALDNQYRLDATDTINR